jgi:hypothetical protein
VKFHLSASVEACAIPFNRCRHLHKEMRFTVKQSKQSERVPLHTVEFVAQIYGDGKCEITMTRVRTEGGWIYYDVLGIDSHPVVTGRLFVPDPSERQ